MSILVGSLNRAAINRICFNDNGDSFSYARIALDVENNLIKNTMYLEKSNTPLTTERLDRLATAVDPVVSYHIVQTQNGTCRLPAMSNGAYLWLFENSTAYSFKNDPQAILEAIIKDGFKTLESIQGHFAGILLLHDQIYYFSTPGCDLFISWSDDNMTVSTEQTTTMTYIKSNYVHEVDFAFGRLTYAPYRFEHV